MGDSPVDEVDRCELGNVQRCVYQQRLLLTPTPDGADFSIGIRDSYTSSKMTQGSECRVNTSDVEHRSYILHSLVEWADEVGRCAVERKFGGGDDVRAYFILEPVNLDTIARS